MKQDDFERNVDDLFVCLFLAMYVCVFVSLCSSQFYFLAPRSHVTETMCEV